MRQPLESRGQLHGLEAVMDGSRSLLQNDGNEYEKAIRSVSLYLYFYLPTPFIANLRLTERNIYRHVDQISKNPAIDVERIRKIKYLHEFDR